MDLKKLTPLLLTTTLCSTYSFAQEPVLGVKNPESLFTDADPKLLKNKQATLHIMRELLQCNQWDRANEWITDRYLQHNPNAASGLDGVIYFFKEVLKVKEQKNCPELKTNIVAVIAEGDYVTVLTPIVLPHPTNKGKTYTTTWFDTWRFVDGKADEHWDPAKLENYASQ